MTGAVLAVFLLCAATIADAQIYRWVDEKGSIHYSNRIPPRGVKATVIDPSAREAEPSPDSKECYTVRCQGERMEERLRRREELDAKDAAARAAAAPRPARGLTFSRYLGIQRGMAEGELLGVAGEPDFVSDHGIAIAAPSTAQTGRSLRTPARAGLSLKTWTYLPTVADPFTTTVTLVGGRVSEVERERKF